MRVVDHEHFDVDGDLNMRCTMTLCCQQISAGGCEFGSLKYVNPLLELFRRDE